MTTTAAPTRGALAGRTPSARPNASAALGLGTAVLWLSLLVLLPLAAVVVNGVGDGWSSFWSAVTAPGASAAIRLTVVCSLVVAAGNAVMGTLIAWVLVRDDFPGRRVLETVIDIPFALPTIVAGVVLNTLYGPHSPVRIDWYATRPGVVVALLFVTLPFVVRAVQPVLLSLDREAEEAATTLGAGTFTVFRRVVLPALVPAIAAGTALAFGRAMGEYGSVVLISGQLPRTEVASQYVYQQVQSGYLSDASAVATVLLLVSVTVLAALGVIQRTAVRRG